MPSSRPSSGIFFPRRLPSVRDLPAVFLFKIDAEEHPLEGRGVSFMYLFETPRYLLLDAFPEPLL